MPSLTLDILTTLVIDHLSVDDAIHFSTICKALYPIVIRKTLKSTTPHRKSRARMNGYMDFVLANPSRRIPLIRKFDMHTLAFASEDWGHMMGIRRGGSNLPVPDMPALLDKLALLLTQVLSHRSIHTISVDFHAKLFTRHPQLKAAFIRSETILDLALSGSAISLLPMLKDMRSNPRVLSLRLEWLIGMELRNQERPRDFSWMPTHWTLQEFRISCQGYESFPPWIDGDVQFPSVKSLYITGAFQILPFVHAFPNVRSLTVTMGQDVPVMWSHLDYLSLHYCRWTVQYPIRRLVVEGPCFTEFSDDHVIFENMRRAHPFTLDLQIWPLCDSNTDWRIFSDVTQHVRLLELHLANYGDAEIPAWVVSNLFSSGWCVTAEIVRQQASMKSLLGGLQVPCLYVDLQFPMSPSECPYLEPDLEELVQSVERLHNELAKTVTTLRFLAITYPRDEKLDLSAKTRTWWHIQDRNDGRVAESIPGWKGERLRTRLLTMDSESLADLKANDIDLLYNKE